jgi:hypothetical protein
MTSFGTPRATRGDPYICIPRHGRSAYHNFFKPGRYVGFRVVCLPREVAPPRMPLRGAPWISDPRGCRSAHRIHSRPVYALDDVGFRVVCLPREAKPAPIVSRGGAWCNSFLWKMRSGSRDCCRPHRADDLDGFRVICLPREVTP